jgi:hypothetical protein
LKTIFIIVITLVIILASIVFLLLSSCATGIGMGTGDRLSASDRTTYALFALLDLGFIIGGLRVIRTLSRKT